MRDHYADHLRESAPCSSRFDGFDRGDTYSFDDRDDYRPARRIDLASLADWDDGTDDIFWE